MASCFISSFLSVMLLVFLAANKFPSAIPLESYPYFLIFSVLLGFLISFSLRERNKSKINFSIMYFSAFVLVFIFHHYIKADITSMDADEYLRLGFSKYISHNGIPIFRDMFVSSDHERMYYYVFLEFISVCIQKVPLNNLNLEDIYFYFLPFIKDILIILITRDIICSALNLLNRDKPTTLRGKFAFGLFYILMTAILIFPPIPFTQAMTHLFYRESGVGMFIALNSVSLFLMHLSYLKNKYSPYLSFAPLFLSWVNISTIMLIKLPFLPVLFIATILFNFSLIFLRKEYIKVYVPFILFGISLLLITESFFPTLSQFNSHFIFSPFSLVRENGTGWYFPLIQNHLISSIFVAFGGIWASFFLRCIYLLFKHKKYDFLSLYLSLSLSVVSGYIATLFIRSAISSGGAEGYWSIISWYVLSIIIIISFVVFIFIDTTKSILNFNSLFGLIIASFGWISCCLIFKYTFLFSPPNTIPLRSLQYCKKISHFRETHLERKAQLEKCAIVNPFSSDLFSSSLNAFCDCGTVTSARQGSGIHVYFENKPSFSLSQQINNMILNDPNPTRKALNYMKENKINELYIFGRPFVKENDEFNKFKIYDNDGTITSIYRLHLIEQIKKIP